MRAFIAIKIPDKTKTKLQKAQDELKKLPLQVKWVAPVNFHITLKFLGNTGQKELTKIKEIITETSEAHKTFSLNLKGFSCFPNQRRPKVIFAAVTPPTFLENIAQSLEKNLEKVGFPQEKKFKPHITLARIKNPKNIQILIQKTEKLEIKEKFKIEEISLFKSILSGRGPVYQEIFKSSLRS